MYSLGVAMEDVFDLKDKPKSSDFFIHSIQKLIAKCKETDPSKRMTPPQVLYFIRELRTIYLATYESIKGYL